MSAVTQIAGGAWLAIRATPLKANITATTQVDLQAAIEDSSNYDTGSAFQFALATGCNYSEDFGVQPLEVLGHLGPVEYNSFNYTCEIGIDSLVAKDLIEFNKFIPDRATIQSDGQLPLWMIEFVSTATGASGIAPVYAQFVGVVLASHSVQVATNQFVSENMRLMARARIKTTAS